MTQQPSIEQIQTALRIAKVFAQTQQNPMARDELRRLRDTKTTWVGKEENDLRFEIDALLR